MTCIAWDGKTLAADKRATQAGLARKVTKIQAHKEGRELLAVTGNWGVAAEIRAWYVDGAHPDRFPESAREDCASLVVVSGTGILQYNAGPYPIPLEDSFTAFGSGRDFAIAAMALGLCAVEAVELACRFETGCGDGVDRLELVP